LISRKRNSLFEVGNIQLALTSDQGILRNDICMMFKPILAFYFDLVNFIVGKSLRFNALVLTVSPRSILKIEPLVLKHNFVKSLLRFLNKDFVEKNEIG
jgi:hypothetical protein